MELNDNSLSPDHRLSPDLSKGVHGVLPFAPPKHKPKKSRSPKKQSQTVENSLTNRSPVQSQDLNSSKKCLLKL